MKKLLSSLSLLFIVSISIAQDLYVHTFGNDKNTPVLFLHGGPGGSSIDFEITTAQKLASKGFFVIVYDRRGEGRSNDDKAVFTFEQTFADINDIYNKYKLKSASIIGHSFGGIVGTLYAEKHPDKVSNLVLAAAPVDLQMSFKTILRTVEKVAESKKDSATLAQLNFVKKQDTASIYYSSGSFMLAMQNGIYTTKNPSAEAKELHQEFTTNPTTKAYLENMAKTNYKNMYNPTMGFLNNEKYTSINLGKPLKSLKIPHIYGIYGKDDGLFDDKQMELIRELVPDVLYLEDCSHGVFMDQQEQFINALTKWLK